MALDLIIRNGTVVSSGGSRVADVAVEGESIAAVVPPGGLDSGPVEVIDATGLHVLPGVIDGHVHFREPGLEHEETWLSGTRAAVFGGVTTVLDMPNTVPPTDTVDRARDKLSLAVASAYCDFSVFGLAGTHAPEIARLAESGMVVGLKCFLGPTTGDLSAPDDEELREALEVARDAGLRVAFHAEDADIVARATENATEMDGLAHLGARPPQAEVRAIDRIGQLLLDTDASGHVLHLSSAEGLDAVQGWRARGVDLACETTPHHALLDIDVYERFGGVAKVNPPIRGGEHRTRLIAALANGQIDCLGSDHAPHLLTDKRRKSIWEVPAGIPGVETTLRVMLTEVAAGRLTLERLVEAMSERPAQIWGLWPRKGALLVGSDADLTLVDPRRQGVIRAADLHGLNNHSPFEGRPTVGAPVSTIVRGRVVVRDGQLVGEPGWGRRVSRP